jgi:hypothetical protein
VSGTRDFRDGKKEMRCAQRRVPGHRLEKFLEFKAASL